ncbi:hypothetical protein JCM6882_000462 [Rhodosporidiobolus microsporus]
METRAVIGPEDRLSTLPVELLEWIFELAYEGDKCTTTGPISRALLPFDRRERFKHVEVKGVKQLRRLCGLAKSSSHLCQLVHEVSCQSCDGGEGEWEHPTRPRLQQLFSALPNIRTLNVCWDSDELLDFVLSPSAYGTFTSRLCSLSVAPSAEGEWDFLHLNRLPDINVLTAKLNYCEDVYSFSFIRQGEARIRYITSLTITGVYFNYPSISRLLRAFVALRSVVLDSAADEPTFNTLVPSLHHDITSLSLLTITCFDDYSAPCDHLLLSFTQLSSLTLGEGIFDHLTLFSNLRRLPALTSLTFNRGAIVSASDLLALISGPLRHSSLTRLTLDMLTPGKRGWRIQEDGKGRLHPSHASGKKHVGPHWILSEFTDPDERFSTSGVEALVGAGKNNGVRVVGSAVEGIEVYRDWHAEAVECLVVYGREKGDYSELREFVGTEEAERLLREREG